MRVTGIKGLVLGGSCLGLFIVFFGVSCSPPGRLPSKPAAKAWADFTADEEQQRCQQDHQLSVKEGLQVQARCAGTGWRASRLPAGNDGMKIVHLLWGNHHLTECRSHFTLNECAMVCFEAPCLGLATDRSTDGSHQSVG